MIGRARLWLRSVLLRRRLEREMQEEMADHLERSVERLVARGLAPELARREALREFGNLGWLQEEGRLARGTRWLDDLGGDARFALRHFARRRGTTLTMLVVLSVGMSVAALLFSFVHSYATRPPLGVEPNPDRVRIRGSRDAGVYGRGVRPFGEEEFAGYLAMDGTFRAVAGWTEATVPLQAGGAVDDGEGLEARVAFVSPDYFPVLGVRPVLGAGLPADASDPSAAAVAVVGYDVWTQLLGGAQDAVGRTLEVNGVRVTVVGVAPERFVGVGAHARYPFWMPLAARPLLVPGPPGELRAAARLRPGVGLAAATAAVEVAAARAAGTSATSPDSAARALAPSADVVPLLAANGDPMFDRDVRLMTLMLGLLGVLVLLVTCTNVSALLTGLAAARRQEIAVRLSLGAARPRLVRQLLTESALLAAAAAVAALAIFQGVARAAAVWLPEFPLDLDLGGPTVFFTFGTALAVGVLFGLSPALHATRLAVAVALRDSSAQLAAARARLQRALVVAQIAFTQPLIVLLAAVLLVVVGMYRPHGSTADGDRLVRLLLRPLVSDFAATPLPAADAALRAGVRRLAARVEGTPGVESAVLLWGSAPDLGSFTAEPAAGAAPTTGALELDGSTVGAGYLRAMGIALLRGRELAADDRAVVAGRPRADVPVVVGAGLARRLWPGADPIGRRLLATRDSAAAPSLVVVGVVDHPPLDPRDPRGMYGVLLAPDTARGYPHLLIRTAGPAVTLLPSLRDAARDEVPGALARMRTVAQTEEVNRRYFRLVAGGVSAAGIAALLLSAIGLYAVIAFAVGQRTGEIAVRMAVGASGRQVVVRFVRDGLKLSALGVLLGLPVSVWGVRTMAAAGEFPRIDGPAIAAVAALAVGLMTIAASGIPARRAAAIDPAVALRRE